MLEHFLSEWNCEKYSTNLHKKLPNSKQFRQFNVASFLSRFQFKGFLRKFSIFLMLHYFFEKFSILLFRCFVKSFWKYFRSFVEDDSCLAFLTLSRHSWQRMRNFLQHFTSFIFKCCNGIIFLIWKIVLSSSDIIYQISNLLSELSATILLHCIVSRSSAEINQSKYFARGEKLIFHKSNRLRHFLCSSSSISFSGRIFVLWSQWTPRNCKFSRS